MPPPPGLDFAGAQGHKPNMTRSPDSDDVWHTSLPPMIVDSATPPSSYKPPSSYREREGGQPHRRPTHPKMVLPPIRTLLNEQLSSDCTPPSSTASSPINSASLRRLPYRDCHSAISTTSTNESSPHLASRRVFPFPLPPLHTQSPSHNGGLVDMRDSVNSKPASHTPRKERRRNPYPLTFPPVSKSTLPFSNTPIDPYHHPRSTSPQHSLSSTSSSPSTRYAPDLAWPSGHRRARRPSLSSEISQSSASSRGRRSLDREPLNSPTTTYATSISPDTARSNSSQRAANWVSQFDSLRFSPNSNTSASPVHPHAPEDSTLNAPLYGTSTPPPPPPKDNPHPLSSQPPRPSSLQPPPSSPPSSKTAAPQKKSCAPVAMGGNGGRRLWELSLRLGK